MAIGLAVGVVGVVFVGTMLRNLLYGVTPFDPVTLAVTALMIVACASIALLAPVRLATQVDPISVCARGTSRGGADAVESQLTSCACALTPLAAASA